MVSVRDSFVVLGQWSWFLWSGHLLTIKGHFGSSVASYFYFIRSLVFLNVPVFLVILAFVVIPQILYRWLQQSPPGYHQNVSFTGEELLTGQVRHSAAENAMVLLTYLVLLVSDDRKVGRKIDTCLQILQINFPHH